MGWNTLDDVRMIDWREEVSTEEEVEVGIKEVIKSQYLASLEMLRQAVIKCPDSLWRDGEHTNEFWRIAYHALFYAHLYLQSSEEDFAPWAKHREEHQFLGRLPWPPHKEPEIGEPYSREEILEYHEVCQQQVEEQVASMDLEAQSGFYWLPFGKLELQFYNIRHIQQHTGELCERLGATGDIEVEWVGTKSD
jgi:hypothetical protein